MEYGKKRLAMGGFIGLYTVVFLGVWSGFVIFFFSKFFGFWTSLLDLPLLILIFVGAIMSIFAFALIFQTLPRFFKGLYYLITQSPVMLLNQQGLHIYYPYRGDVRWDNVKSIYFTKGRKNWDNIVIKTHTPTPLAKRLGRPWRSFFSPTESDEHTVRILVQEMGLKVSNVHAALEGYAHTHRFKLERL